MMPKTRRNAKSYIVRNPRGIPKGRHIIRIANTRWYEGDSFSDPPPGIDVGRLVRGGFLEEKGGSDGDDDNA